MSDHTTEAGTNGGVSEDKVSKRASVSLIGGEGGKAIRLTILARRVRGDRGETVVTTTDAAKKSTRGMTVKYETFDLAVEGLAKLRQEALQKGWRERERVGGFKSKPDAFSAMPVPPKATR